jgi:tetratricopeptide (TPR) repeat protein
MPSVSPKNKSLKSEPAPAAAAPSWRFETLLLKALIIVFTGLFVYVPAFHGDWLWDDDQEITQNALLPDPNGLVKIWQGESGADYLPLKSTVQWVYFQFFKADRTAWHILNVVLHLVNALLFWRVLARLGVRQAWLGGLLFSIHPILVESVAWVSELKNTLSLPFLLLAMLTWISYEEKGRARDYIFTIVLYLMAILCKSAVIMFPCVLVLYSWWRSMQPDRQETEFRSPFLKGVVEDLLGIFADFKKEGILSTTFWTGLIASLPFFAISAIFAWVTIHFQHGRAIGSETIPVGDMLSRTEIAGYSVWFYISKIIAPFGLLPIYERWVPQPWMLIAWPALAAVIFGLWTQRKTWGSHALLGFGFFLVNLFPIIGFIKMSYMRITWAADHFLYLPALGLIGLAAAGVGLLYERSKRHNQSLLAGIGAVVLAALAVCAHGYAGVFANEYEMWTHTLKHNPNAWQAHSRLGKVMIERGDNDKAFYHISESVRLRPDLAETHNNYGAMLEKKGDINGAIEQLRMAVERAEDINIYKINLASLLVRVNRHQEGAEIYKKLLETDPNNPTFLCNLGVAQYFMGQNDAAIESFQKALAIAPNLKDARDNLQQALLRRERGGQMVPSPGPAAPPEADPGILGGDGQIKLFGN